jgi:hypothetical protein
MQHVDALLLLLFYCDANQDPYVHLHLLPPSLFTYDLKELPGAGRNPSWKDIRTVQVTVHADTMKLVPMQIEVRDKNIISDAVMGSGLFSLKKLASIAGTSYTFTVRLKDSRKKPAGKLVITAIIEPVVATETKANITTQSIGKFLVGNCSVSNLPRKVSNLQMKVSATMYRTETSVKSESSSQAAWDMRYEIPKIALAQLLESGIKVEVLSKGSQIGIIEKLDVSSVTKQLGKWVELVGPMKYNGKLAGDVTVQVAFYTDDSEFNSASLFSEKPAAKEGPQDQVVQVTNRPCSAAYRDFTQIDIVLQEVRLACGIRCSIVSPSLLS